MDLGSFCSFSAIFGTLQCKKSRLETQESLEIIQQYWNIFQKFQNFPKIHFVGLRAHKKPQRANIVDFSWIWGNFCLHLLFYAIFGLCSAKIPVWKPQRVRKNSTILGIFQKILKYPRNNFWDLWNTSKRLKVITYEFFWFWCRLFHIRPQCSFWQHIYIYMKEKNFWTCPWCPFIISDI